MARKRFHGLKKVKVRASWNKYNLYNLSRLRTPNTSGQTFYQQKWSSKSLTRAYHGEQIREKQWQRMFTSNLNAVIPMDHKYLAEFDGSELAAGRGSGVQEQPDSGNRSKPKQPIPYMHMTYAPIERRLDMAIFRALFASSARQARQFVVHGKVTVNGQKMPYPGYLLNPGDMFQVDVDSVLFATGAPKEKEQRIKGRRAHRVRRNRNISQARFKAAGLEKKAAAKAENGEDHVAKPKKPAMQDSLVERKAAKKEIQLMIQKADMALDRTVKLGAKRHAKKRHELRVFKRAAKNLMGQVLRIPIKELDQKRTDLILQFYGCKPGPPTKDAKDHLMKSMERMKLVDQKKIEAARAQGEDLSTPSVKIERVWTVPTLDPKKRVINFRKELASAQENPTDLEKPYATPWQPRPYMSAFAFIPRYLEVHHSICSAVYLRHPVARPGIAEVPSPFPTENQQLAFNWYLRRR